MKNNLMLSNDSEIVELKDVWTIGFYKRIIYSIVAIDLFLGFVHLLFPEYSWGQGRKSYFNLGNQLTFASWFAGIQIFSAAFLFFIASKKSRWNSPSRMKRGLWILGSLLLILLSFMEITNAAERFQLLGFPNPDIYEHIFITFIQVVLMTLFGLFLTNSLNGHPSHKKYVRYWLAAWGIAIVFNIINELPLMQNIDADTSLTFIVGTCYLLGCTFLLAAISAFIFFSGGAFR